MKSQTFRLRSACITSQTPSKVIPHCHCAEREAQTKFSTTFHVFLHRPSSTYPHFHNVLTALANISINILLTLPGPSLLPARKTSASNQMQPTCKHITVTRLYENYGSHRCQVCHRHPVIGWVYRCTQDHEGFLPESDFMTIQEAVPVTISEGTPIWRLKQWIYEAVLKGQYTVEQFSTLFQQRQAIKKAIFSQGSGTATPSTPASPDYCSESSDLASTTLTSIASSYPEVGIDLSPDDNGISVQDKYHQRTADQLLGERGIATNIGINKTSDLSYPACTWTCCQACRPTYCDRAWQSLDPIVNEPTKVPPAWEFKNRRISDARIVANIGLPKLGLSNQVDDSHYASSSKGPLSSNSNLTESDIDEDAYGLLNVGHTQSCFWATVRRTLKETIGHNRASSSKSQKPSKSSNQTSLRRVGRSILFRSRRASQSTISHTPRIIGDGQLQESVMLMVAIDTPLPAAAADVEDLHDGEVEVEDGFAVIEEGIVMGTADITMQV
jgi:hypothetical protein